MDPLPDPCHDRVVKTVPAPPHRPLQIDQLIKPYSRLPNYKLLQSHLASGGYLSKSAAVYLISQAKFLFERERSILETSDPITIIGDIHGQFFDLLYILEHSPAVGTQKFLFLGDYVDRGRYSIEVVLYLFALKINFPHTMLMLRGNHETRQMTNHFSFRKEVLNKYELEIFEMIMEAFDAMPLACVVNNEYFVVHGGISPSLRTLEDIVFVNRFKEPDNEGLVCDLLWADPCPDSEKIKNFDENRSRGCSVYYGDKATKTFLNSNRFKSIIRAHEVQKEGFKIHTIDKTFSIVTVFSAANYCGTIGNKGAFCRISNSELSFHSFVVNPEPYDLPFSQDLFAWSVPYVIEQVLKICNILTKPPSDETLDFTYNEDLIHIMGDRCFEGQAKFDELMRVLAINGTKEKKQHEKKFRSSITESDFKILSEKITNFLTVNQEELADRIPFLVKNS